MFPLQLSKFQTGQIDRKPDISAPNVYMHSFKKAPSDGGSSVNRSMEIIGCCSVLLVVVEAKIIDQAVLFMLIIVASQTIVFARTNPRFLSLFWMQGQPDLRHTASVDGKNDQQDVGRPSANYSRQHAIKSLLSARPFNHAPVANHHRNHHAHANDG